MNSSPGPRGLPPRTYVPIVLLASVIFLGIMAYLLRIGLGVTGAALGPAAQPQSEPNAGGQSGVGTPISTRAPGEAAVPLSTPAPQAGGSLPGQPVGGGGPAAGPPAPVMRLVSSYRARLAKNRDDRDALLGLASLEVQANRFESATPLLARAVALQPGDAAARMQYALALHGAHRDADALPQISTVVRARPSDADALYALGLIARDAHRDEAAREAFRRFLRVAPDDSRAGEVRAALAPPGPP